MNTPSKSPNKGPQSYRESPRLARTPTVTQSPESMAVAKRGWLTSLESIFEGYAKLLAVVLLIALTLYYLTSKPAATPEPVKHYAGRGVFLLPPGLD